MASQKLEHYLRTCRKRSGLSQGEVAYLLGSSTRTKVSRYERGRYVPTLRTALVFEALFGTPVSEIFAGLHQSAEKELRRRARALASVLRTYDGKRNPRLNAQKLKWLVENSATTHYVIHR
jgi:DNA-binding XRE family transcriptional regulator